MSALSFQEEWLDKLLRGDKQQTTRPQTTRIWTGDPIVHIYNQQRRRIADKEVRTPTEAGIKVIFQMIDEGRYPKPDDLDNGDWTVNPYYAHFLGKVEITEVYDIHPCDMSGVELNEWAVNDGFHGFHPWSSISSNSIQQDIGANMWFLDRYGDGWMRRTWTVIRWAGWIEQYFLADEGGIL